MCIVTIQALCDTKVNHQALASTTNEQQLKQTKSDEESHATSASDGLYQHGMTFAGKTFDK